MERANTLWLWGSGTLEVLESACLRKLQEVEVASFPRAGLINVYIEGV